MSINATTEHPKLRRRLGLAHLVLYGLGVTIGAGIYVLVGLTAAEAGLYAPISFLLAATIVLFTGLTYAELSTRFPVSAGEAVFVNEGFARPSLSLIVGLMVAASGVVSSATISVGAATYLSSILPLTPTLITIALIVILALTAMWGILESVTVAALFTLVEIVGLLMVMRYGFASDPTLLNRTAELIPPLDIKIWSGIASGAVLAFFAFIGFEDLANIAEEAKHPERTMPRAILWTLVISTLLYVAVVSIIVLSVPMESLHGSVSSLALIFPENEGRALLIFTLIAGIATVNGVLIQMIMSSRVLYGLAKQGQLPAGLGRVSAKTGTPVLATGLVSAIILFLALAVPVGDLAEWTSRLALLVFALVNAALIRIKLLKGSLTGAPFQVSILIPIIGCVTCSGLLLFNLVSLF